MTTPETAEARPVDAGRPVSGLVRPVKGGTVRTHPERGVLRSQRVALDPSVLPVNAAEAAQGLSLPLFPDTTVVVEVAPPALALTGYQSWHGSVAGAENSSVIFVETQGELTGWLSDADGGSYRLRSDGAGGTVVEQIDQSAFPSETVHPAPPPHTGSGPEVAGAGGPAHAATPHAHAVPHASSLRAAGRLTALPAVQTAPGDPVVDMLVAYSTAAKNAKGGQAAIEADIALAIEQTNQAFAVSGVAASVRLVRAVEVALNADATGATLDRFRLPADGWNDEIHALRDYHGADLAALIVDDAANQACGLAYLMGPTLVSSSFAQYGFSVSDVHCSTGTLTFAHELGHNFGAAHDRGAWAGTPAYPYGYDWVDDRDGQKWRTVMSYPNACRYCTRLARFSNPDLTHNGAPTGAPVGAANQADNRSLLNQTASVVAAFRGDPIPVSLSVTGPTSGAQLPVPGVHNVTWTSTGNLGPTVKIELLRGSTVVSTLAAAAPSGSRSYAWTPAATLVRADDYRVRITSVSLPGVSAASDPFALVFPALTVTSHAAPQTWSAGTPQRVTWTYTGAPVSKVRLELVREERTVFTISAGALLGTAGGGSHTFTPPAGLGDYTGYRVRATLVTLPTVTATSSGDIDWAGTTAVRLTSQNDGALVTAGTVQTSTWTTAGTVGASVKLELVKAGQLVKVLAASTPAATGSFTWTAPATLATGADYRVRATAVSYPLVTDSSDARFPVDGTSVTLTGPDTSSALVAGVPVAVTWGHVGTPGTAVKLEAVPATGKPLVITSAAPLTARSFTWTPPLSLVPGMPYRVRATVNGNVFVTDTSDADTLVQRPTIAVTGPASTDWVAGKAVTIGWQLSDGASAPATLQLLRGTSVVAIASTRPTAAGGAGSVVWTPSAALPPAADYRLKVFTSTQPAVNHVQSALITVRRPTLAVTSVASPVQWTAGTPVDISWSVSDGSALPVNLQLVRGTTVVAIRTGLASPGGAGTFRWTPPLTLLKASDWRVRVSAKDATATTRVLSAGTVTIA